MAKTEPAAAGDTILPADDQAPAEATPEPTPEPTPELEEPGVPEPTFWQYLGGLARTYLHIPVTVEHGDVITHPGPPAADGNWEAHPGPVTRHPDNHEQPAPADDATAEE